MKLRDIPSGAGLPEGTYQVKLSDFEWGMSAAVPPKPKITVKGQVVRGEHINQKFVYSYSLAENAMFRLREDLLATGIDDNTEIGDPASKAAFAGQIKNFFYGKILDCAVTVTKQTTGKYAGRDNVNYKILGVYGATEASQNDESTIDDDGTADFDDV